MSEQNHQSIKAFKIQAGDVLLTTLEYEKRYKVSRATQCRRRKQNLGPPFIIEGGRILYPESGIVAWMNANLVINSEEQRSSQPTRRYEHLAAAREKAREAKLRRYKSSSDSDQMQ